MEVVVVLGSWNQFFQGNFAIFGQSEILDKADLLLGVCPGNQSCEKSWHQDREAGEAG